MEEIEIEGKALVSKKDFFTICQYFNVDESEATIQHNYYFETNSFSLKNAGAALRIREKENTFTLTLKHEQEEGIVETHQPLTKKEWEEAVSLQFFPNGAVVNKLESMHIDLSQLQFVGTLTTRRIEFPYEHGLLCLDISEYFDHVDYEIEFEGSSKKHVETTLQNLFTKLNIVPSHADPKISRFFQAKRNNK